MDNFTAATNDPPLTFLREFSSSRPSIKRSLSPRKQAGGEKFVLVPSGFADRCDHRSVALAVLLAVRDRLLNGP